VSEAVPTRIPVLLVDDDIGNLLSLEVALRGMDLDLVQAMSGTEALRQLLIRDFPLVLLDVRMPDMDGFELAHLMRGNARTRDIPIIFMTANPDQTAANIGYAHGAVDYLFKPIVPEILRAKVSVFVELHRKTRLVVQLQKREHEQKLIEERQRWEAERMQAELAGLKTRDEFLSMASHELKTPLTSMQLLLSLETKRRSRESPEREFLLRFQRQMDRLLRLTDRLIDAAFLKDAPALLSLGACDLVEVVNEAVDELRPAAELARCEISIHAPPSVNGTWDRMWLSHAVANLLDNALKFGAGGKVQVTIEDDGATVRISVSDRGIGVEPADQKRLFELFARPDASSAYGGLGLGLFIVRRVAESHGGRVAVHSDQATGSSFVIELPRQ
jgi:signal transduction histidine kinase